jgi:hypothetical protein
MMNKNLIKQTLLAGAACMAVSSVAVADHMSIWGEGWANMPNEIHNLRMEYQDDNDAFLSEVQYGAGAVTGGGNLNVTPGEGSAGSQVQGTVPVQTGGRDRGR